MADEAATVFIYTTFGDVADAERVGGELVERGLAACANIFPGMKSIYVWKGEVQRDGETAMILKTNAALADRAMAEAKVLHPYEAPALVAFEARATDADFTAWIAEQTGGAGQEPR